MIELMSKEISQYSKRINQQEDIDEDFLLDINQLQENTMLVRENIVDKQRLISNMLRSDKYPKDLHRRFSVLLQTSIPRSTTRISVSRGWSTFGTRLSVLSI